MILSIPTSNLLPLAAEVLPILRALDPYPSCPSAFQLHSPPARIRRLVVFISPNGILITLPVTAQSELRDSDHSHLVSVADPVQTGASSPNG